MKRIVFIFLRKIYTLKSFLRVLSVEADQSKCKLKDVLKFDGFFQFNAEDSASLSYRIAGECF